VFTKYATRREKCALRALYLACRLSHLCAKVSVVFSLLATYCFFCILVEFISSCHFFSHYLLPNVVQVARTTDDLNLAARFALCMFMILFKIRMNCGLWIQNCKTCSQQTASLLKLYFQIKSEKSDLLFLLNRRIILIRNRKY